MTRNKLWRLSLAAILGFGWLFLTPAYSDDPLSLAAKEIQELNEKVGNLTEYAKTQALIDIAEDKYDAAVAAKAARDAAYTSYNLAVESEAKALLEKNTAQSAVDGQTATVATSLSERNSAKDSLDISAINLSTANSNLQSAQLVINAAGGQGLQYTVYNLIRTSQGATPDEVLCTGTWNSSSMQLPVCGYYENIVVKFTGKITVPSWFTTVSFGGYTDDGFRMFINGSLAVNNWVEQGVRWSAWSPTYNVSENKTLDVEIWWYNGGGPGSYHLGWTIPGGMTGAGCDYAGNPRVWGEDFSCDLNTFSSGPGATQAQIDAYNAAVTAKATAQTDYNTKLATYNTKLSAYNTANSTLTTYNQTLTTKTTTYNTSVTTTANALTDKNNTQSTYDQSIIDLNNAIDDAWKMYNKTWLFEEQQRVAAAIATALANMPQPTPTPEVTVEPTQEPSPEPTTEPTEEPTPEPTEDPKPEPTDEPTPDPEPTDEPVVDPTEEPTPEPTTEPTPEPEPTTNPEIEDEELAALIPEKGTGTSEDLSGVIANLTSKDNKLVTLSPEQIAAVSQTLKSLTQEAKAEIAGDLGIKASEVAQIAEQMKDNTALALAFVEFNDRAESAGDTPMPFTLADAVTEVQTEAFLSDPIGAIANIDFEKLLSPSEWGKDMTDDQREKAQEVIIPVIIAGNIVAVAMTRRI